MRGLSPNWLLGTETLWQRGVPRDECIAVNIQYMLKAIGEEELLNHLSDLSLQLILL